MTSVPERFAYLEQYSTTQIEAEVLKLRSVKPRELTDEQCELAVALHAIAARKTSGPAKPRASKTPVSLDSLMM